MQSCLGEKAYICFSKKLKKNNSIHSVQSWIQNVNVINPEALALPLVGYSGCLCYTGMDWRRI